MDKPIPIDPEKVATIVEYMQNDPRCCELFDLRLAICKETSQLSARLRDLDLLKQQLITGQPESSMPSMLEQQQLHQEEEARLNNEKIDLKAIREQASKGDREK